MHWFVMDNCDLSKLTVKPGKLVPKFSPSVLEYSVTLPSDVQEVKFSPLTSDSGASYLIKVRRPSLLCRHIGGAAFVASSN